MSRRLFASAFTVPLLPAEETASFGYNNGRSLNLDSDGVPAVQQGEISMTGTITEVRGEASDPDNVAALGTLTKARGEAADRMPMLTTQTRIRKERSDRESAYGHRTSARNHSVVLLGTQTAGSGEPSDPSIPRDTTRIEGPGARPARRVTR